MPAKVRPEPDPATVPATVAELRAAVAELREERAQLATLVRRVVAASYLPPFVREQLTHDLEQFGA